MPETRPEFFIIGEPKSGTTALASFLAQHPDIFISQPKEPGFFCTDLHRECDRHNPDNDFYSIRDIEVYLSLFQQTGAAHSGEASTNYLYSKEAAANIHDFNKNARIIAIFREPVSFLSSLHNQYVNETVEDQPDFSAALAIEGARRQGRHIPLNTRCPSELFYRERIKYCEQLKRYIDIFGRENVLTIIFDDFAMDNAETFRKVCEFIKVNNDFTPDFIRVHERKRPRLQWLNKWVRQSSVKSMIKRLLPLNLYTPLQLSIQGLLMEKSPPAHLDESIRQELMAEFKSEVMQFSELVSRDLVALWRY